MSIHREGMTAQDHRDAAAECRRRSYESFQRSDTDGFRSQAAGNTIAAVHDAWADLLDNGGMMEKTALFLLDGTVASVRTVEGQYGISWLLNDDAARALGKRFVTDSNARKAATRQANNAKKGFAVGYIRIKGYADVA